MGSWNPFGGSSGDAGSNGGDAITAIGNNVASQTAMTPQATQQLQGSYGLGQSLEQMYQQQLAAGANAEQNYQNQGPLAQSTYNQTLQQSQNPLAGYQSTLKPQLEQAQNQINEYYNARGLDNSGIAIGAMGTAGVDLAIQQAQQEMQYQQQSLSNANALSTNISGLQQQNLQNVSGLYGQQQGYGLQGQSLANQGLESASQIQTYPAEAQLGSYYGGIAAQQALPGQLISAGGQLGSAFLGSQAINNLATSNNAIAASNYH
jgi:hypothetical protein